ncbi:MAG: GSCFA domain-containing protein [Gelidibacter sp.]
MKLQTNIPLQKRTKNLIDYQSKVFLLGSCFVENIGQKLTYFKFQSHQNPFGVLFHPKAIETIVVKAVEQNEYNEKDVFFHNEQWHCYEAHSKMSNISKDILIANLNEQLQVTRQHLKEASHIVITLGTAWVYKHTLSDLPVANCHKVSQQNFTKALLSIKEITDALQNLHHKLKAINAKAVLIFTVSPIRHIKDGFIENTRSKAHLITAIHDFIAQQHIKDKFYFPSYEIMMDELRDYRFYTEDMLHPNATAINYIWEKFQTVWMSDDSLEIMAEVDSIQKGMAHLPFNPTSEAHTNFLKQLEFRKETLQKKFHHITF